MTSELSDIVRRLSNPDLKKANVIMWGSPIISFGNLSNSKIATLGLNPSNKEFVDSLGNELIGNNRRFHSLKSLGLKKWSDASEMDLQSIFQLCNEYFFRNPYDQWFKRLDYLISGTSLSYYFPSGEACHLDLIPYATSCKWADLTSEQKKILIEVAGDTLGLILRDSPIKLIVLNGQTVVENLEKVSSIKFQKKLMPAWTLPRKDGGVSGYSYSGFINRVGSIKLNREIKILGFNHNIQSSFGVTSEVQKSIRIWITKKSKEIFE